MAKINRPSTATSWAESGERIEPSISKIQKGWLEEIPPRQYQNWYQYNTDQTLKYLFQSPIPEWSSETEYFSQISYVLGIDGVIYQALQDNVAVNPSGGANPTVWRNLLVHAVNTNRSASTVKLETARKISGVPFDGTSDIIIKAKDVGALPQDGNAASATKLLTARKIANIPFDGTKDIIPDGNYITNVATVSGEKSGVNKNINEIKGLTTPLSISQGGTEANTVQGVRLNLLINKFQQNNNNTSMYRNDERAYLNIDQQGMVGYYDISSSTYKWSFDADGRMQTGIVPVARVEGLESIISDQLPVGIPLPYPLATPPTGWLIMQGQIFSLTDYPELAKVYPTGRLPDMRGLFIRGWDNQKGYDPNRGLLTEQEDAIQRITGEFCNSQFGESSVRTGVFKTGTIYSQYVAGNGWVNRIASVTMDSGLQTRTAAENRPKNIAFNYIVRAK